MSVLGIAAVLMHLPGQDLLGAYSWETLTIYFLFGMSILTRVFPF